ncbi:putative ankyrin repeat protein [Golovinomyces cichoracearum]|uniref:Putative ankyrin repeat protein n=1 Tax=Golovinomyces cichoracearum TaxID=62708 RepID=A0A420JB78_9PEZI|nr:putative ankyrin repeat protein [Golovinomyces cichoracearum]
MRVPNEPIFSPNSPPVILDVRMSEQLDIDPDFEFFDATALDSSNSPVDFVDDLGPDKTSQFLTDLLSPKNQNPSGQALSSGKSCQSNLSTPMIDSPSGSYQDSSSESSEYPRKSSSASLTSALTPGDIMMGDDADVAGRWSNILGGDEDGSLHALMDGCINPSAMNVPFLNNDTNFDHEFNFVSSASSPSFKAGIMGMDSPEMPNIKIGIPVKHPANANSFKVEANSQQSVMQNTKRSSIVAGTREVSPPSTMISRRESPPNFLPSPSPGTDNINNLEYANGTLLDNCSPIPKWAMNLENYRNYGLATPQRSQNQNQRKSPSHTPSLNYPLQNILTIHPTPLKSRVETQIPIKMTLHPLPIGITKLHLPTHTISKPKLLAKPTPERSSDTLELYTSLVCTSAMQNPDLRKRAFERAAASARAPMSPKEEPEGNCSDEDDENKPANGGEVKICGGCIIRERKRAARKKAKKVEEEETWQKYETQRVIVFNTHEIKDWQPPSQYPPSELTGEHPEPYIPEGAMQVDAPMRIACYCRHQNEKLGFQVILTIKDYQDKLVAQAITSSIMITDDHKTSAVPSVNPQVSSRNDLVMGTCQYGDASYDPKFSSGNPTPFRISYSSSDLQALQRRNTIIEMQLLSSSGNSPRFSHSSSTSVTPRMSRQTSPSTSQGPLLKKRKASGSNKLPSALTMTRLESGENQNVNTATSSIPTPFTPNFPNFPGTTDRQFTQAKSMQNISAHFNGPPTPNSTGQMYSNVNRSQSMDNLAIQSSYNVPGSGIPSRVSSPNGIRLDSYQRQQTQMAHTAANGFYGIPMSINSQQPPIIHKMIPSEGPKAGGIEVTCLGIGFVQGLEVMFGDMKATTTTYWGETSLVCLLPPSSFAGNYPVTFKHQHQQFQMQPFAVPISKQQAYFKYVDDDELQILRTALSVLGHKMTGKMEDVRDLARRIVGENNLNWNTSSGLNSDISQVRGRSGLDNSNPTEDLETILLKFLDLIDLDDSPNMPRYNLRRKSGQTMLHLACSLGFDRFIAALLARGVNPDPKDNSGYTPMHFAALHNHPKIVRRLIFSGADPTIRNFQGDTPSDMSNSQDILQATQQGKSRSRRCSLSSQRSRTSSIASMKSSWESGTLFSRGSIDLKDGEDINDKYKELGNDLNLSELSDSWIKSRLCLSSKLRSPGTPPEIDSGASLEQKKRKLNPVENQNSSSAALLALRHQISTHIQQLQQIINLPYMLQMPRFDLISQIPALPDYQAYLPNTNPMVRRITNFVQRPGYPKEQDYKWCDIFSANIPTAPPSYEDIFPESGIESNCASKTTTFSTISPGQDQSETSCVTISKAGSREHDQKQPVLSEDMRREKEFTICEEKKEKLELVRAEKSEEKSLKRRIFFIWVSMITTIIAAVIYNYITINWFLIKLVSSSRNDNIIKAQ